MELIRVLYQAVQTAGPITMIDKITGFEAKDIPILNKALDTLDRRNPNIDIIEGVPVFDGLRDLDGDTQVQVEESPDEDKVRIDTGGTERVVIDASGADFKTGAVTVVSGQKIGYEGMAGDTYWAYNAGNTYLECYVNGELRLQV